MSHVFPMGSAANATPGGAAHERLRPRSPANDDSFAESLWLALIGVTPRLSEAMTSGFALPGAGSAADPPSGRAAPGDLRRAPARTGEETTAPAGEAIGRSRNSRTDTNLEAGRRDQGERGSSDAGSPASEGTRSDRYAPSADGGRAEAAASAPAGPGGAAGAVGGAPGGAGRAGDAGPRAGNMVLARLTPIARGPATAGAPEIDARTRLEAWLDKVNNLREALHRAGGQIQLKLGGAGVDGGAIRLALRGSTVLVTILAADRETARRMESSLGDLRQSLAGRGFADAQLTVRPSGSGAEADHAADRHDRSDGHPDQSPRHPAGSDRGDGSDDGEAAFPEAREAVGR